MNEHQNIFAALNAVMQEVTLVHKQSSDGLKYTYLGEAALISAVRPALVKHGIVVLPAQIRDLRTEVFATSKGTPMNRTVGVFSYTFVHGESDTSFTVEVLGEGMDTGDKSANKAMTGAYKYALRQALMIESGEDPDRKPSRSQQRGSDGAELPAPKVPRPMTTPQTARPYPADTFKTAYQKKLRTTTLNDDLNCSQEQAAYVASLMGKAFTASESPSQDRLLVLSWLVERDVSTSLELTEAEASVLIERLADGFNGGPSDVSIQEIQLCYHAAKDAHQKRHPNAA